MLNLIQYTPVDKVKGLTGEQVIDNYLRDQKQKAIEREEAKQKKREEELKKLKQEELAKKSKEERKKQKE